MRTTEWRGKPVWVIRRSEEQLAGLKALDAQMADPNSDRPGYTPEYAKNEHRSRKPDLFVCVGICTHLGCSPTPQIGGGPADPAGEQGGELLLVAVLELEDDPARRLVIDAGRPRPAEGVRAGDAGRAPIRREIAAVVFERRAAAVADRRLQKGHPAPGVRRQARGRRRLAAVVSHRRQQNIQQAPARIARAGC